MSYVSVSLNGGSSVEVKSTLDVEVIDGVKFNKVARYGENGIEFNYYKIA